MVCSSQEAERDQAGCNVQRPRQAARGRSSGGAVNRGWGQLIQGGVEGPNGGKVGDDDSDDASGGAVDSARECEGVGKKEALYARSRAQGAAAHSCRGCLSMSVPAALYLLS